MKLSPLKINLLLHIYAISAPFNHPDAPAYVEAKKEFVNNELVYETDTPCGYALTRKGEVLIDSLLNTPMPVLQYTMPARFT